MKALRFLLAAGLLALDARADEAAEFFETHIRPLLVDHCYQCHSAEAEKFKGGLRLDSREAILKGGDSGAAIVPGKPEESLLITAVRYADRDLKMPPPKDEAPRKLSDAAIANLAQWVRLGAPMPAANAEHRTPDNERRSKPHWAFVAPRMPQVPAVKNEAWVKTDIDRFILAKLEAAGLAPAPPADPRTLIRRMTFDLTGLPPAAEDGEAAISDLKSQSSNPHAGDLSALNSQISTLLDRLLASPHYGERWARHWLDVARYSDTKGYVYAREERFFVHAWAYRDWVVKAFNDDMPFDRFLLLQIAADQLVPAGSPDLAAMGFVTGGRRFIGVSHDIIDDRIDVVTRGTMALTVQCARCHDHKYDPISTRDYYSLYGVFAACEDRLISIAGECGDAEYRKLADKLADTMKKRRDETMTRLRTRVADYLTAQFELHKYPDEGFDQILEDQDIIPASVRRWRDFLHRTARGFDPIFAPWHALAKLPAEDFEKNAAALLDQLRGERGAELNATVAGAFATPPKSIAEAAQRYGEIFANADQQRAAPDAATAALIAFLDDPRSPATVPETGIINNELFFTTAACEELWKLQGDVERWLNKTPTSPAHALVLADREPERNPRVFIRGNPARQGDEVPRQFLEVVAGPKRRPFQNGSGRLDLAQAIVRPDNPLTARVMVNRIWQHHFGTGLVRTPSDFGTRAEPPSHAELLDWLALKFIESGWSVKAMHRLIMSSAVYQQAGSVRDASDARLLSRFPAHRLDFEEVRDAMLAATGELDATVGGRASELFAASNKRRTLYGLVDRQFLPGTFRVFDFANPDISTAQRHATTIPQQALFFLNHTFVADRARALAGRDDIASAPSDDERLVRLYRRIYQRQPTAAELDAGRRFIAGATADVPPPPPKPVGIDWRYGWGEYDTAAHRTKTFHSLPHFTGKAWQGGAQWPDGKLGWAQLTADGGHPGNDLAHACIRRWTAPRDGIVTIGGTLIHEPEEGDGIRALIVSSRHGEMKSVTAHHSRVEMSATGIAVELGDTLDFIVDIGGGLNSDQFLWSPTIAMADAAWNAKSEFAGPPPPERHLLAPWAQYAQALLLANEFSFVD
jgi:cytochrome c553